jgi:hypothetical protein
MIRSVDLAIALVAAHLVADFVLQRASWVEWKAASVRGLASHAAVYGILTWLLLPIWSPRLFVIILGLTVVHGLLDVWKARRLWPYDRLAGLAALTLDQCLHLVTMAAAVGVAPGVGAEPWLQPWAWLGDVFALDGARSIPRMLTLVAAYALAVPGGSVIVRSLLEPYKEALPGESELSLGRVIGYLERLILLTLLLLGEYAAMAVIVAAKSLIRIPSIAPPGAGGYAAGREASEPGAPGDRVERVTTEYFLIGTLGSIAVALFAGIAARWVLALI